LFQPEIASDQRHHPQATFLERLDVLLSGWSGQMVHVPLGIIVDDAPDGGRLVQLTAAPFDMNDPAHEAVADALYRTIATAFGGLPPFGEAHIPATYAMLGWAYPPQPTAP
jgi:hypothetical protein